jgi:hypothetical protein
MNVAVVGSFREENERLQGSKEDFEAACAAIGKYLATSGNRLIVPHPKEDATAEAHTLRGFRTAPSSHYSCCPERKGDPSLKAHFEAVEKSDAVILLGGSNGTYAAGLSALRRRKLILPIPTFGGSAKDLYEIPEIENMLVDEIRNLQFESPNWIETLVEVVNEFLSAFPRVLIIHGRGDNGVELQKKIVASSVDVKSSLRGIAAPVIMDLAGMGAVSVPESFEGLASQVSAAIAIVTADDVGGFARGEGREYPATQLHLEPRARENVWVEVGWFWGRLGRHRVFLWLKDEVRLPTDLQGAAWTRSKDLDGAWTSIEAFLVQRRDHVLPGKSIDASARSTTA